MARRAVRRRYIGKSIALRSIEDTPSDIISPVVLSISSSAEDGSYILGQEILILALFDEAVLVEGTPQLELETGATDRKANYVSGTGTTSITFSYTVQAGDTSVDLDYVATNSLTLNGGTMKDAAGNNADLTLPEPGADGSLGYNKNIVIDTTAPAVSNITSLTANGSYRIGQTISIQIIFTDIVTVTGVPQLELETGATDRKASYASGTGSTELTFTYTTLSGDTSGDLDYKASNSLTLNGGTIKDIAENVVDLTLPEPGAAGSLGYNKSIVIDTTAPTVVITSTESTNTYLTPFPVTITFSEAVVGFDVTKITVGNGVADNFAGTGPYTADITPTVPGAVTVDIAAGACADAAGNDNTAATQFSINFQPLIVPVPAITSTESDPTKLATFPISIDFNTPVTNFTVDDLVVTNGIAGNFLGTGASYTADVVSMGDGEVTINIASDVCESVEWAEGNDAATEFSITVDTSAPSCVITTDDADPTIVSPFTIRVTFSEPVVGFVTGDITVANGTKVTFTAVSSTVYTQTIVPNASATVTVDVNASVCIDAAGNENTAASQVTVASKVIVWDTFTDTNTTLNATPATPGPGTRVETDTGGKISTNGSDLVFITGATANDAIWWDAVTRGYGAVAVWAVTPSEVTTGIPVVGWDSAASGAILDALQFGASSALKVVPNGGTAVTVGAYTAAAHYVAAVQRATGIYWYIKGGTFTNWTYLWPTAAGTGNGYPGVQAGNTTSIFTVPFMRAFKAGTYDVPVIAYDTFTQGDGAVGNSDTTGPDGQTVTARAWTGAGGAISTNKLVITPTEGAEMWDAAASVFTSGIYSWEAQGTNNVTNDANTLKMEWVDNALGAKCFLADAKDLNSDLTVGEWYKLVIDTKINTGSGNLGFSGANGVAMNTNETSFTTKTLINRASNATTNNINFGGLGAGEIGYFDNISLKPLTFTTCLESLTDAASSSVVCSVNLISGENVTTTFVPSGIIVNLDSIASPANFVLVYFTYNYRIFIDKRIGGTWSNVQAGTSVSYSAGKTMGVHTTVSGTNLVVRVYYDGVLVGAEQTIADAAGALRTNTIHGLFSTSSANSFTNFDLRTKTGYTGLDAFIA